MGDFFMKVRVFDCDHEADLESSINDFIDEEDIEVIDIKFSVSACMYSSDQIYCFSALIMYK